MSQLSQLKSQVAALGRDASATATSLAGYKAKFSESVGQVTATVGGSAQHVDQDMIATLKAAEQRVDDAIVALQQAAKAANSYASSL
ncbi:hypothetical protein CLV30_11873 [Haloactinopolyspora alba]|uniref:Uncharacterized protein n=1 Tax=Haloactinopolyspora alba TaxID=648780 RepID=A0A2P8DPN8_9ACTN|nr:hypothetical protein [Haloactinopolyspora alba]PSK99172.1 hypothetical protein CLV30_11873 [Haloactinopolyspora alba]